MIIEPILTIAGVGSATLLIAALIGGLIDDRLQIWPAPPAGSLKSVSYWTLFRTLNVAVLGLSAIEIAPKLVSGFDHPLQAASIIFSAAILALYLYALWALGREATYCKASGLQTAGIYQWSRNPQYATAIVAYGLLAIGLPTLTIAGLSLALIAVYALMARSEEAWLRDRYGAAYDAYRNEIPRFFNLRRAVRLLTLADGVRTSQGSDRLR